MFFINTLYLNISKIKSKTFKLNEKQMSFFNDCLKNICEETNLLMLDNFIQHGNTTCLWHSIAVAYYAYCFSQFFNIKCDEKSLIYGALLHDYFLYDWHIHDKFHRFHGFKHPKTALNNALKHYSLNKREIDIIKNHMFPLTLVPPHHRESILVNLSDKICSSLETFNGHMYKNLKENTSLYPNKSTEN